MSEIPYANYMVLAVDPFVGRCHWVPIAYCVATVSNHSPRIWCKSPVPSQKRDNPCLRKWGNENTGAEIGTSSETRRILYQQTFRMKIIFGKHLSGVVICTGFDLILRSWSQSILVTILSICWLFDFLIWTVMYIEIYWHVLECNSLLPIVFWLLLIAYRLLPIAYCLFLCAIGNGQ